MSFPIDDVVHEFVLRQTSGSPSMSTTDACLLRAPRSHWLRIGMTTLGRIRRNRSPKVRVLVIERLTEALGGSHLALAALNDAMIRASMDDLPGDPRSMVAFLATHLRPILETSLEPAAVETFFESVGRDFEKTFGFDAAQARLLTTRKAPTTQPESSEAKSGPRGRAEGLRVVLVDEDAFARSSLARVLVRMGASVRVASSCRELSPSDVTGAHVLSCDLDAPDSVNALREIMSWSPELGVVARADTAAIAEVRSKLAGATRYRTQSKQPRESETVASILALWRGMRDD